MSLIVHAPNVHRGGGKALLLPLLESAARQRSSTALLHPRLEISDELGQAIRVIRVTPSVLGRLRGEWTLRQLVKDDDTILCFGNLPPLFGLNGRAVVFVQNRYLVERCRLDGFPPRVKFRLLVERLWLRWFHTHADAFIVQTKSMQQALEQVSGRSVQVMAFFPNFSGYERHTSNRVDEEKAIYDFLYPATGEPHKNHLNLLEAWKYLASEGLYPSLCLTVSESDYRDLFETIERVKAEHKLNLYNVAAASRSEMQQLYGQARALIYPSLTESFGLPLVEARIAGLLIVAAELDYVRDLVDPDDVFNPRSPLSIARSIKRVLHVPEAAAPLMTADEFVDRLLVFGTTRLP